MKIKSLLLGSAAALVATTAAHAADAIVVEPEPVEYVRVCDAYGSGYWYIPGTETCIKIGGYVRTTYSHVERDRNKHADVYDFGDEIDGTDFLNIYEAGAPAGRVFTNTDKDGNLLTTNSDKGKFLSGKRDSANDSTWSYRGRLNFEVKNETEYGTLSSYLRVQGDGDGYGDGNLSIDRALISIAGFRGGYGDTYWTTNHDYGAGNPAINDGYFGFDQAAFADYTFAFEGFAFTGGVQQSLKSSSAIRDYTFYGNDGVNLADRTNDSTGWYDDDSNTVDWYAGINWKTDWMTLAFTALSDNNAVDARYHVDNVASNGVFGVLKADENSDTAFKASLYVPFGDTSWRAGGWYAWESNGNGRYIGSGNALAVAAQDQEWGVWLGGNLTDNFDIYGLYTEISGDSDNAIIDYKEATGNNSEIDGDKFKQWTVGARWFPVNGLQVQFEYTNEERKADYGYGAQYDDEADQYQIRVVRSW